MFFAPEIHTDTRVIASNRIRLHNWRENAQHVLDNPLQRVPGTVLKGNLFAGRKGFQKIFFYLRNAFGFIHPDAALKMQVQAAEIQVRGAYGGYPVI